jgi:TrmH family RNA methyltransferase
MPEKKIITSTTNQRIQKIVRLHTVQGRKEQGLFLLEGERALRTASEKLLIQELYCTEQMSTAAHQIAQAHQITLLSDSVMKKISTATTPSGLLGIFAIPQEPPLEKLSPGIVLAQINDPGNMGTLIRTAAACRVTSIIIVEGCDPWSSKVLQATAGTFVDCRIFHLSWETLINAKRSLILYGLTVKQGNSPHTIDRAKALLVIGNEARGIPPEWLLQCDAQITLPMPGDTESLNAAVAGSIATYLTFVQSF